ncbi:hypothetical protein AA12717_1070 [Gluconacetobacter sacchari DSM 12717]|uniref:Uncharacterized protein n=1 Tax=Gluconacetobacter sacchari DSM 12717 TaxID=1307940 RepID=A0ABQ0P4R9_9PROT|nr:hypothetical protein AA12717_1070 [Gluconacetobacter sacchari DSM 12717]
MGERRAVGDGQGTRGDRRGDDAEAFAGEGHKADLRPVSSRDIDEIAMQGDPVNQQRGTQKRLPLDPINRNIGIPQDEALGIIAKGFRRFRENLTNVRYVTLEQIAFKLAIRRAAAQSGEETDRSHDGGFARVLSRRGLDMGARIATLRFLTDAHRHDPLKKNSLSISTLQPAFVALTETGTRRI